MGLDDEKLLRINDAFELVNSFSPDVSRAEANGGDAESRKDAPTALNRLVSHRIRRADGCVLTRAHG